MRTSIFSLRHTEPKNTTATTDVVHTTWSPMFGARIRPPSLFPTFVPPLNSQRFEVVTTGAVVWNLGFVAGADEPPQEMSTNIFPSTLNLNLWERHVGRHRPIIGPDAPDQYLARQFCHRFERSRSIPCTRILVMELCRFDVVYYGVELGSGYSYDKIPPVRRRVPNTASLYFIAGLNLNFGR